MCIRDRDVSALIINPVDFTGLSEELKEAREANIPVITVDTDCLLYTSTLRRYRRRTCETSRNRTTKSSAVPFAEHAA